MKKYAIHIIILIALIGFFSPVAKVNAASGSCTNSQFTSEQDCRNHDEEWVSNDTARGFGCSSLGNNPKFQNLLGYATCIINSAVIPLIFALALAMFVWGVVQYVINSSEEAKKEKGRQFMIWGIIALAVMVSVWGLVGILGNTFGIEYVIPQVKSVSQ